MSKAVTLNGIGVQSVDSFTDADGLLVERVVYDVPGHNVQIVRHNGDSSAVVVRVDNDMAQIPLHKADTWVRNRI